MGNFHSLFKCPVCNDEIGVIAYDAPLREKERFFECRNCRKIFAVDELETRTSSRKLVLIDVDRKLAEKLLAQKNMI